MGNQLRDFGIAVSWRLLTMLTTLAASFALAAALSGQGGAPKDDPLKGLTMKTYQFVFLKTGDNLAPLSAEESQKKQAAHLAYLEQLWLKDKKAVLLGPVMNGKDVRGIVVLDCPADEARILMDKDPFVSGGHLKAEIRPLMAADGFLRMPPKFMDLAEYTLGFFHRPAKELEKLPADVASRLQNDHLLNNKSMADRGALVWAGPFLDGTSLRGLLVFRSTDREKLKEMLDGDPLVKAGRLVYELFPAYTSKGAFPEIAK